METEQQAHQHARQPGCSEQVETAAGARLGLRNSGQYESHCYRAEPELQTVLEVLLRRLPSLELAVPVEQLQKLTGLLVGGLRELPVRW